MINMSATYNTRLILLLPLTSLCAQDFIICSFLKFCEKQIYKGQIIKLLRILI